ncbi:MAG TPA: hydantoinase B/oxoprolinase family protein, partial [Polyangiaceae bacterium]|nr:hydantoinase B/oxoprolinase family protein [Polyangiaceae bacterium]
MYAGKVVEQGSVTDVLLTAFGACACSQGCMNNLTCGSPRFGYYETIAGGSDAGSGAAAGTGATAGAGGSSDAGAGD